MNCFIPSSTAFVIHQFIFTNYNQFLLLIQMSITLKFHCFFNDSISTSNHLYLPQHPSAFSKSLSSIACSQAALIDIPGCSYFNLLAFLKYALYASWWALLNLAIFLNFSSSQITHASWMKFQRHILISIHAGFYLMLLYLIDL